MLYYFTLFLVFLYFKVARVHKKEEKLQRAIVFQHILVAISALLLYGYGFLNLGLFSVITASVVFFIVAALMVTAVQLGIFIDGKPQFGISKLYRFLPLVSILIILFSVILWI